MNEIHQYGQGDNVAGDKVMGDKVAGNKTVTNFTQNNSGGTNFQTQVNGGTVNQAETINIDNSHTQVLQLVANLRQLASSFPQEVQDDLIIDIDDVEEELKKPEGDRNPKKLKKRLLALAAATTLVATPVAGMTDFTNNVLDIGEKLGIELPSPSN